MTGMWNLLSPHAMPEAILSEGACSHILCWPLLRRAYPIDGAVELAGSAHDAGNYFVRECVLLHHVPAELD